MFDSFYTPTALAEKLTNYVSKKNVSLIADFSVGDGELLRAAEKKWPHASMIASDVHDEVLRMTKRQHSSWLVGRCDFLNPRSRNLCKPLRHHIGLVDLVLLNPPFSCGRKTIRVMLDGREFRSGAAIAFVALSLEYLQSGGELFAIMPQSCSHSLRDRELWEYLQRKHGLKELANVSRNRFEGCDPKVIFISLIKGKISVVRNTKVGSGANMRLSSATPMRGKTSMVRAMKKGKYPLYHTTHLQDHTLQATSFRTDDEGSVVNSPAVLIPRVGTPRVDKVCLIDSEKVICISECIIAIKTKTKTEARVLYRHLLNNWSEFQLLYKGTCARYVTIKSVKENMLS